MARLIDADKLLDKIQYRLPVVGTIAEVVSDIVGITRRNIEEAPTVDAVPVVRCKDCKQLMLWRKPTDKVIGECFIRKMNSEDEQFCMVGADDFCSHGERRMSHGTAQVQPYGDSGSERRTAAQAEENGQA